MFIINFENVLNDEEKKKQFEAFRKRRIHQEEEKQKHKVTNAYSQSKVIDCINIVQIREAASILFETKF